jgi:hypothetical protein
MIIVGVAYETDGDDNSDYGSDDYNDWRWVVIQFVSSLLKGWLNSLMANYKVRTIIRTTQEQSTKQRNKNSVISANAVDIRTSVNVKSEKGSASFAINVFSSTW